MAVFDKGYGLIIAVANYPKVRKLPETVLNDGRDLLVLLRSSPYCGYPIPNTRLLLDDQATAHAIRNELQWLAASAGKDDTGLIFFSGHGARIERDSQTQHYLIPYDCDPSELDKTAISGSEFTDLIRNIGAQRLLVLLDCCYSGGTGETKDLDPQRPSLKIGLDMHYYEQLAQGTGRVIMASSRSDEVSLVLPGMTHSLFTYCLLEALQGRAYTQGDGLIRVFDVFDYISEAVPARGAQHPIFKASDLENDFPIALYVGGQTSAVTDKNTPVDKSRLREIIVEKFKLEEIEDVCADIQQSLANEGIKLQVNLDMVSGTTKRSKVRELIDYLDRNGYLPYLVKTVQDYRPGVF